MFSKMFSGQKSNAWALTILRVIVGLVLIYHGYPKLFGDEATKNGMIQFFSSTILPAPAAMLLVAGILEVLGGILLVLGAYTGVAANILVVEFLVIIFLVKLKMGWKSMELDLLMLAGLLVIAHVGSGALGIESLMGKKETDSVPVQPGMGK